MSVRTNFRGAWRARSVLAVVGMCCLLSSRDGAAPLQQDGSQIVLLNEYNAVREDRSLDDDGTDIFFDRVQGNGGNWFELVVVGDGTAGSTVDLRGWTIAIEDDGAPSAMTLSDHEYWRRVQAGTILTFIEKNDDHPRDTSTAILKEDRLATAGWAWTNVWTGDEAYVSDGGSSFSVSHDSTQFTLKDRTGHIVFGPAGEKGSFVGGGIGSREVYQLLDDPSPQVTPGSRHTDETNSSFGAPNGPQCFAQFRSGSSGTPTISDLPCAWSAVVGDTNAERAIPFTLSDSDTDVDDLHVMVVSDPDIEVAIQGTGTSRTLNIDPDAIGHARIALTVSDGVNSSTHEVSFAASQSVNASATTRWHTGGADASTAVAVGGLYAFVADDEDNTMRLFRLDRSDGPERLVSFHAELGRPSRESDIESSARDGSRIYWLGSHSNSRAGECRRDRFRLVATDLDGAEGGAQLSFVGRYDYLRTDLRNWDDNDGHGLGFKYFGLAASTPSCENDERDPIPESENRDGFNIEGLVMAPYSASTAFVGFRAPLVPSVGEPAAEPGAAGKPARTHALLVSVTNFDELSANGGTPGTARFGPPIRMDLGGRGIRSIDKNDRNEYVIVAGPPGSANGEAPGDFRLFTWNGLPASPPQLRTADLSALTPPNFQGSIEGIVSVPAPLTSASLITLVSDNGDTDYYEDGTEAKDLPQASHQKFRTDVVSLGEIQ